MILYGSLTSPYVRRIRAVFDLASIPYVLTPLNIYEAEGQAKLKELNPARRIPVLVAGHDTIVDSNCIYEYLQTKGILKFPPMNPKDRMDLQLVNELNDAMVVCFQCEKQNHPALQEIHFYQNQKRRVQDLVQFFVKKVETLNHMHPYVQIAHYCLWDWAGFRSLLDAGELASFDSFKSKLCTELGERLTLSNPSVA
jgi:glutathione S-transferase